MKQKLTLSIEPEVIHRVKQVASQRNTTVSSLFEDWGRRVVSENTSGSTIGDDLQGSWAAASEDVEDAARLEYLMRKHGGGNARAG